MKNNEFENIKILYVEDEDLIRKHAITYLKRLFKEVYEASNALDALNIYEDKKPDIIITDIKMPKMSGIEFVKEIRKTNKEVQIIMLTAFSDTSYLLDAVELGLVKYIIKPIKHDNIFPSLLQCVKNIKEKQNERIYFSGDCTFDIYNKTLINEEKIVKLNKNELALLELLCKGNNKILTYQEIEDTIWYDSHMSTDAIRSLVKSLRKKLPKDSLINIAKVGYKIEIKR